MKYKNKNSTKKLKKQEQIIENLPRKRGRPKGSLKKNSNISSSSSSTQKKEKKRKINPNKTHSSSKRKKFSKKSSATSSTPEPETLVSVDLTENNHQSSDTIRETIPDISVDNDSILENVSESSSNPSLSSLPVVEQSNIVRRSKTGIKEKVFSEIFDWISLDQFMIHFLEIKKLNHWSEEKTNSYRSALDKLSNLRSGGYDEMFSFISYEYSSGFLAEKPKTGRKYSRFSNSIQSIPSLFRHIFLQDIYIDLDLKSCHPSLLLFYLTKEKTFQKSDFPFFINYLDNVKQCRDKIFRYFSDPKRFFDLVSTKNRNTEEFLDILKELNLDIGNLPDKNFTIQEDGTINFPFDLQDDTRILYEKYQKEKNVFVQEFAKKCFNAGLNAPYSWGSDHNFGKNKFSSLPSEYKGYISDIKKIFDIVKEEEKDLCSKFESVFLAPIHNEDSKKFRFKKEKAQHLVNTSKWEREKFKLTVPSALHMILTRLEEQCLKVSLQFLDSKGLLSDPLSWKKVSGGRSSKKTLPVKSCVLMFDGLMILKRRVIELNINVDALLVELNAALKSFFSFEYIQISEKKIGIQANKLQFVYPDGFIQKCNEIKKEHKHYCYVLYGLVTPYPNSRTYISDSEELDSVKEEVYSNVFSPYPNEDKLFSEEKLYPLWIPCLRFNMSHIVDDRERIYVTDGQKGAGLVLVKLLENKVFKDEEGTIYYRTPMGKIVSDKETVESHLLREVLNSNIWLKKETRLHKQSHANITKPPSCLTNMVSGAQQCVTALKTYLPITYKFVETCIESTKGKMVFLNGHYDSYTRSFIPSNEGILPLLIIPYNYQPYDESIHTSKKEFMEKVFEFTLGEEQTELFIDVISRIQFGFPIKKMCVIFVSEKHTGKDTILFLLKTLNERDSYNQLNGDYYIIEGGSKITSKAFLHLPFANMNTTLYLFVNEAYCSQMMDEEKFIAKTADQVYYTADGEPVRIYDDEGHPMPDQIGLLPDGMQRSIRLMVFGKSKDKTAKTRLSGHLLNQTVPEACGVYIRKYTGKQIPITVRNTPIIFANQLPKFDLAEAADCVINFEMLNKFVSEESYNKAIAENPELKNEIRIKDPNIFMYIKANILTFYHILIDAFDINAPPFTLSDAARDRQSKFRDKDLAYYMTKFIHVRPTATSNDSCYFKSHVLEFFQRKMGREIITATRLERALAKRLHGPIKNFKIKKRISTIRLIPAYSSVEPREGQTWDTMVTMYKGFTLLTFSLDNF